MIAMLEQKSSLERDLNKRHPLEDVWPLEPLAIGWNWHRDDLWDDGFSAKSASVKKKCSNLRIK